MNSLWLDNNHKLKIGRIIVDFNSNRKFVWKQFQLPKLKSSLKNFLKHLKKTFNTIYIEVKLILRRKDELYVAIIQNAPSSFYY